MYIGVHVYIEYIGVTVCQGREVIRPHMGNLGQYLVCGKWITNSCSVTFTPKVYQTL